MIRQDGQYLTRVTVALAFAKVLCFVTHYILMGGLHELTQYNAQVFFKYKNSNKSNLYLEVVFHYCKRTQKITIVKLRTMQLVRSLFRITRPSVLK